MFEYSVSPYHFRFLCDDNCPELYINEVPVPGPYKPFVTNDVILDIPNSTRVVIAAKIQNGIGGAGLVACVGDSVKVYTETIHWKCTNTSSPNWMAVAYDDSQWPRAYLRTISGKNALARVVLQKNSATSAGPLLNSLHWLPVHSRIKFKIATITYIHNLQATLLPCSIIMYQLEICVHQIHGFFLPTQQKHISACMLFILPHQHLEQITNWCQVCMFHIISQSSPQNSFFSAYILTGHVTARLRFASDASACVCHINCYFHFSFFNYPWTGTCRQRFVPMIWTATCSDKR